MIELNVEEAIKIYYSTTEIGNKELKMIYGNICPHIMLKLKKQVKEVMDKEGVTAIHGSNVNTKIAYKVWGLDIRDLEHKRKKLKELSSPFETEEVDEEVMVAAIAE